MSIKEEFLAERRAKQIEANNQKEQALNEAHEEFSSYVRNKANAELNMSRRIPYMLNVAKTVMCEAFSELYMNSIPIDDYYEYRDSLHESATNMLMDEMADINSIKQFRERFKNTSPYIQAMTEAAIVIAEKKADDIAQKDEEYPKDAILDSDDIQTITDFEKIQGKDIYADELKNRVVDVYTAEAKLAEDERNKTQEIVDALAEKNNGVVNESVLNTGMRLASNGPKTLFNAIFMNKSKTILNEAGAGADLDMYKEDVLVETLCTYTLLECVHALGIKTFDYNDRENLKVQFMTSLAK